MVRRVLLDEGVPRHLAAALEAGGFSASAYPSLWKQTKNGELLRLAEREGFEVLITSDKNIYAQQNLRGRTIAALRDIKPKQYVVIEADGSRSVSGFDEQCG